MSDQPIDPNRSPRRARGEHKTISFAKFVTLMLLFIAGVPAIGLVWGIFHEPGFEEWEIFRMFLGIIVSPVLAVAGILIYLRMKPSQARNRYAIIYLLVALVYGILVGCMIWTVTQPRMYFSGGIW